MKRILTNFESIWIRRYKVQAQVSWEAKNKYYYVMIDLLIEFWIHSDQTKAKSFLKTYYISNYPEFSCPMQDCEIKRFNSLRYPWWNLKNFKIKMQFKLFQIISQIQRKNSTCLQRLWPCPGDCCWLEVVQWLAPVSLLISLQKHKIQSKFPECTK